MIRRARAGVTALPRRGREWVERQDPASPSGVAINVWRRYRAVDGPLQSALLSLYVLIARTHNEGREDDEQADAQTEEEPQDLREPAFAG